MIDRSLKSDKLLSLNFIQIVLDEGKDRINWGELIHALRVLHTYVHTRGN